MTIYSSKNNNEKLKLGLCMYLFIYFTYFVGLSVCLPWPEANAVFGVLALKSLETLVYNWHWGFFFKSFMLIFSKVCVCI